LLINKNVLYTVSQDTSFTTTDIKTLDTIISVKKVVSNMSTILDLYKNYIVTSNPNRNEITIWNTEDLSKKQTINFPTGGLNSKGIIMENNYIYGSNQDGIYKLDIQKIL
jgi:hypothetical protein